MTIRNPSSNRSLFSSVVRLGLISLLSAIGGEAARSAGGPLLAAVGASAAVVGIIAGTGELLGYALRLGAGVFADRPGGAWRLLFAGTVLGISAVGFMSIAPGWRSIAALLLIERVGRALRTPARDVMLSEASESVGHGRGFGLHRLLDQAGAVLGPLGLGLLVAAGVGYQPSFAILVLPSLGAIYVLRALRRQHSRHAGTSPGGKEGLPPAFWIVCTAGGLLAAGTVDFALISFHYARTGVASAAVIPLVYSLAMAVEGVAALGLGFLLHRSGPIALLLTIAMSVIAAPVLFFARGHAWWAVAAWSSGMGGQYAVLRALIPGYVPAAIRGSAFGWFNTIFGICWCAGSAAMGILYARDPAAVVWLAVCAQVAAVPVVLWLHYRRPRMRSARSAAMTP
jgi:MFS family permease